MSINDILPQPVRPENKKKYCYVSSASRHMQGKRALVELNDLNHLSWQSTEISSVEVFRPKEQFCADKFLISGLD